MQLSLRNKCNILKSLPSISFGKYVRMVRKYWHRAAENTDRATVHSGKCHHVHACVHHCKAEIHLVAENIIIHWCCCHLWHCKNGDHTYYDNIHMMMLITPISWAACLPADITLSAFSRSILATANSFVTANTILIAALASSKYCWEIYYQWIIFWCTSAV